MAAEENNPMIESFMFRDAPIEYAMSMLSDTWGRHIVVNDSAKKTLVRTFLKDIDCMGALKAVCHGHGLWYREDPESGIIYVQSLEEYAGGGTFNDKKFVEVLTLTYPRCEDIAAAIQEAYRDMVVYTAPDQDDDDEIGDISRALDRMDQLADRSTILEGDASGNSTSSSSGRGRSSSRRNNQSQRGMENMRRYYDDVERIAKKNTQAEFSEEDGSLQVQSPSIVFVSIVRRSNSIVLRSSDREMLNQIRETVRQLDIPKAQVLLEVRVLQLDVTDEKDREIDFLVNNQSHTVGNGSGGFSQNLVDIVETAGSMGTPGVGSAMGITDHSVFQLLNNHYQVRLNFLDGRGKVRSLATPSLLVADYEASRVFIGKEMSIVTDVEETQSTSSGDNAVTTATVNPTIERRDIGTTLVITPKVHSDGTVTLRIMQENATADEANPTVVDYGAGHSFTTYPIKKQTITSSIVAKNSETIALGGLMQHEESDTLHKIPWLGDIPFLGALFRHTSHDEHDYELMVLIKPTVILTPSGANKATQGFLLDNMQDKRGLHEAMDKTRIQRRGEAEKKLSEEESANTNTVVNTGVDVKWMPTDLSALKETLGIDSKEEK